VPGRIAEEDPDREQLVLSSRTDHIKVAVEAIDGVPTARLTSPATSHRPVEAGTLAAALASFRGSDVLWRESSIRFHARNAFAVGGVVEDPATGAAAAAFGGYLRDAGFLAPPARLTILQGEDLGRPSALVVDVPADRPGIDVSGSAVPMV
jgi:PhzF family phenazine biosynthesis protein